MELLKHRRYHAFLYSSLSAHFLSDSYNDVVAHASLHFTSLCSSSVASVCVVWCVIASRLFATRDRFVLCVELTGTKRCGIAHDLDFVANYGESDFSIGVCVLVLVGIEFLRPSRRFRLHLLVGNGYVVCVCVCVVLSVYVYWM